MSVEDDLENCTPMEKRDLVLELADLRLRSKHNEDAINYMKETQETFIKKTDEFIIEARKWRQILLESNNEIKVHLSKQSGFMTGIITGVSAFWVVAFAIFEYFRTN